MKQLTLYSVDTAPEGSKPLLEASIKRFGMIPNLHAVMAESPGLLEGYQTLHKLAQASAFDAEEITVVWQSINVEHGCHYCVPAHTFIANSMKVDPAISEALRSRAPMPNEKLQALQDATLTIVRNRGQLSAEDKEAFYAAGYETRHLLDIILVLSQKVMSNYVNHIAETPVDAPFAEFAWEQ